MRVIKRFVIVCLLLFALTPVFAQDSAFEAATCPFDIPAGQTVECGYLTVPEDHSQPDGATLRLAVAIFRSPNPDKASDPIVYLEGGPGGDALETVPLLFNLRFAPLLENRDLIMFDQRGTGFSEPSLACPEYTELTFEYLDDYLTPEESASLASEALMQCRERLANEGVNFAVFNSAASAADLDALRQALGYKQWNLWGVSYGTRLALTAMRDFPEGIRSVVLDSAYPLESNLYASIAANGARAIEALFTGCAADPACNAAYPDLEDALSELVGQLNDTPVTLSITNPLNGQRYDALITGDALVGFVFQSLYVSDVIPLLPQIIFDGLEGNFDSLGQLLGAFLSNSDFVSIGMQLAVQCNDEVGFSSEAELSAALEDFPELRNFLISTPTLGPGIVALCESWGGGETKALENEPVSSDIPTLVLAGEYDPITPPTWSQQVAGALENAYYVEFRGQGHGPSLQNSCARAVMQEFFDDPANTPEAACIADMTAPPFAVPESQSSEVALVPFTNDTFGITGVVPEGWSEVGPGVYRRGNSALDGVLLLQQASPSGGADALLELVTHQLGLDAAPDSVGEREANGLTWALYELEVQGIVVDMALAEQDGMGYIVLMQYPPDEREALYTSVFLAAVDALQPA